MNIVTPRFFVTIAMALMVFPSMANDLEELRNPVDHAELDNYRGGFVTYGKSLIDIGISISTGLNGEQIYQSHIANLTIMNGALIATVLQGDSSTDLKQMVNGSNIGNVIQSGGGNIAITPDSFIGSVIQNSLDGQVINLQTTVDIRAEVDGIILQSLNSQRMQDALSFSQ